MTTATNAAPTRSRETTSPDLLRRILFVEVRDELRAIVREPAAIGFSVLMPVAFFALFVGVFGGQGDTPTQVGTTMLATFGTFGVLSVTLMNPGIGLAADRERGWLRVKRAAAVPFPVTVAAKILAAVPYAVGVIATMTATAFATGRLDATASEVLRLIAVLIGGATAFVPLALAVGAVASSSGAAAILNALLIPMAVASGLWMPLEVLPDWVASLAPGLPAYHLAELAKAQLAGGGGGAHGLALHGLALLVTAAAGAGVFALAYRHARP